MLQDKIENSKNKEKALNKLDNSVEKLKNTLESNK